VELEFPPIAFDPAQLSCCCGFPAPPELGAINPHAVYDHGQSACQRHDRLFHPAELVKALLEAEFATASDTQSAIGEPDPSRCPFLIWLKPLQRGPAARRSIGSGGAIICD